jgi:hypothetical protein
MGKTAPIKSDGELGIMHPEADTEEDPATAAMMPKWNAPDDPRDVLPLPGYRLAVRFMDGVSGIVDASALIASPDAGVFAQLRDTAVFGQVCVRYGAVTWPGEIDLAPDVMYDDLRDHGEWKF